MSLPVLHAFAGYSIHKSLSQKDRVGDWKRILLCMVMANLADLDFVPGIWLGNADRFHRGISHSAGAALLAGAAAGIIVWVVKRRAFIETAVMSTAAYLTHVALDFLGGAGSNMPILWPFTHKLFRSSFMLLDHRTVPGEAMAFAGANNLSAFLRGLMDIRVMHVLLVEISMVVLICEIARIGKRLRTRAQPGYARTITASVCVFAFFLLSMAVRG